MITSKVKKNYVRLLLTKTFQKKFKNWKEILMDSILTIDLKDNYEICMEEKYYRFGLYQNGV